MSETRKSRSGLRGSFRWPKRPKKPPVEEIVSLTYICDNLESKVLLILSYGISLLFLNHDLYSSRNIQSKEKIIVILHFRTMIITH